VGSHLPTRVKSILFPTSGGDAREIPFGFAEIALPDVGTSAIPLLASVPFSQDCTVEVRPSDKNPALVTESALNSFVPKAGALL
jgi:hypothetical protein